MAQSFGVAPFFFTFALPTGAANELPSGRILCNVSRHGEITLKNK